MKALFRSTFVIISKLWLSFFLNCDFGRDGHSCLFKEKKHTDVKRLKRTTMKFEKQCLLEI